MFNSLTLLVFVAFRTSISRSRIFLYHCFCIADIPTNSLVSIFGSNAFSTSLFNRLSKNGLSMRCSLATISAR
jgi:hypothetical protein